jgi:hypothetical protein
MQMGITGSLEFKNRDEGNTESAMSLERGSEFVPALPDIRD